MTVILSSNSAVLVIIDLTIDRLFFAQKDLTLDHKTVKYRWYVAQWHSNKHANWMLTQPWGWLIWNDSAEKGIRLPNVPLFPAAYHQSFLMMLLPLCPCRAQLAQNDGKTTISLLFRRSLGLYLQVLRVAEDDLCLSDIVFFIQEPQWRLLWKQIALFSANVGFSSSSLQKCIIQSEG